MPGGEVLLVVSLVGQRARWVWAVGPSNPMLFTQTHSPDAVTAFGSPGNWWNF